MEKIKTFLSQFKKWIWAVVAGVVIAFVAWKHHVKSEVKGETTEDKEAKAKQEAHSKQKEQLAKLEEEQKAKQAALDTEMKKALEAAKLVEELKKAELETLAKQNKEKFKSEITNKLGVKEKKKGRPKKK